MHHLRLPHYTVNMFGFNMHTNVCGYILGVLLKEYIWKGMFSEWGSSNPRHIFIWNSAVLLVHEYAKIVGISALDIKD